ncbi:MULTISPECIES: hypothetical protein [Roseomonadaceae]|uniref:Uncharacterized protein n=1 Tax=Falsiroseomonas oleicola TaxID=2801474 RepID=A0ABS6H5S1_9PROT|nr:hypothetical protein [Roseomonas oleicola]MBU8544005.1 hypothetical protein [Roseomonas oleicola]
MSVSVAPIGRLRTAARVSGLDPQFFVGSTVTWLAEFRDPVTKVLRAAPGDVVFVYAAPDGTPLNGLVGQVVSTGVYAASITPDDIGGWFVRIEVLGARIDERAFGVVASSIDLDAEAGPVLVDDDGEYLLLDDGTAMEA